MKKKEIAIVMGSDSDVPVLQECFAMLDQFKVGYDAHVLSAHRCPDEVARFARNARKQGYKVIIAGAGAAAHLAGVIAAHTTLPVIGIPLNASDFNGMDSLLATVQMPAGVPVATVAVGKPGAINAALLAVQIMSVSNARYAQALAQFKKKMIRKVHAKNVTLQKLLKKCS